MTTIAGSRARSVGARRVSTVFFFFSSRRRHTRLQGDWSSDVCSSDLIYRLNIGVSKSTFDRLVGSMPDPDYTALDKVLPHPVYAPQHWLSILNPSDATFESTVKPLLDEAYERIARSRRPLAAAKPEA